MGEQLPKNVFAYKKSAVVYLLHRNYLAIARFARKKGECGSFFGQSPKNEPPLFLFELAKKTPKQVLAK
jgi:hypothetical protein